MTCDLDSDLYSEIAIYDFVATGFGWVVVRI